MGMSFSNGKQLASVRLDGQLAQDFSDGQLQLRRNCEQLGQACGLVKKCSTLRYLGEVVTIRHHLVKKFGLQKTIPAL